MVQYHFGKTLSAGQENFCFRLFPGADCSPQIMERGQPKRAIYGLLRRLQGWRSFHQPQSSCFRIRSPAARLAETLLLHELRLRLRRPPLPGYRLS